MTTRLPIPKERLEQTLAHCKRETPENMAPISAGSAVEIIGALLAAHEQEPIYQVWDDGNWADYDKAAFEAAQGMLARSRIVYTHPAPVPAVPDYYVVVTTANVWQTFCKTRAEADFIVSKPFHKGYYVLEVYTRRAAMLNGGGKS